MTLLILSSVEGGETWWCLFITCEFGCAISSVTLSKAIISRLRLLRMWSAGVCCVKETFSRFFFSNEVCADKAGSCEE